MTTYLLVFNPIDDGRDAVLDLLDGMPEVADWHASMNHAVVLVSSATATQLTERVRDRFPGVNFVVTPLDADAANGILPRATWNFLSAAKNGRAGTSIGDRNAATAEPSVV